MAIWSGLIAKPQRTPLKARPSLTLYFLLAGAFLLTLVPHFPDFPAWVTAVVIASMALRSLIELYRLPLPSTTFCGIVAFIFFVLVWAQYGNIMGRSPGTALTAGLLAIKFYEIRQPRELALIIFSCYFVVMSALLFSQVLELFIYCLIMMWVLTAVLVRVQAGDSPEDFLLRMLGRSGLVFLQAMPLTLLLFFFFPRIDGPIGLSLNDPPIGLTDTVAPGSFSKLARDDTEAMHVKFGANYPLPESMYWRALTLYFYHNGEFTAGFGTSSERISTPDTSANAARDAERAGLPIEQTITIKPNNQRWLYALDVPITEPRNMSGIQNWAALYNGDTARILNGKVDHTARYAVVSSLTRQEQTLKRSEYEAALQLPTEPADGPVSPQVYALADELYTEGGNTAEGYAPAVLRYFHHKGFVYSIDLPPQGKDWLREFLIERKTGYCEHFATAFTLLMRIHNIPSRLVTGYVGGDFNPYDNEWVVRESSAHAWCEVWEPTDPARKYTGRWKRIDPTAFVGSVDASGAQSPGNGGNQGDSPLRVVQRTPSFTESYFPGWVRDGLHEAQLRREQMESAWDNVVLSYDTDSQFRLAKVLGMGQSPMLKLSLVCLGAMAVCAVALWRWLAHQPGISPVEFLYAAFCRNMARRGVPRATWEGPLAYTERVAEAFPDDTPALRSVGAIVARTRYGPQPGDVKAIERLESALARISASQAAGAREKR